MAYRLLASRRTENAVETEQNNDWARAAGEFFAYVATYRGRPEYDQDPYSSDHTFLPLFKVFHGAANQYGFRLSNEAYIHHLLCTAGERARERQKSSILAEA